MPPVNSNIETIAKRFWEGLGEPERYPCDIQRAISLAKNVFVVSIPELSMGHIKKWLHQRSFYFSLPDFDKPLHGFLLTNAGAGLIFINGGDTERERRFTLAHEIAHYILDYEQPRQLAVKRFGSSILEVLDGLRLPTAEERLQGLVTNRDLTSFTHLLDEASMTGMGRLQVWSAETRADQLALELLAPSSHVRQQLYRLNIPVQFAEYKFVLNGMLCDYYGLPTTISESYATYLAKRFTGGTTLAEHWGFR